MKTIKFFSILILLVALSSTNSIASKLRVYQNYKVDEMALEEMFESSEDITFAGGAANFNLPSTLQKTDTDKQMIAGIIAIAEIITGIGILIPIHRLVLGTGNETAKIIALYCVTLGGCGLLTLIDAIMLLIDSGGNKYIENSKFIMWID